MYVIHFHAMWTADSHTLHLHGALPICSAPLQRRQRPADRETLAHRDQAGFPRRIRIGNAVTWRNQIPGFPFAPDLKSTRLNSSHLGISYAVFCLEKKNVS